MLKRFALVIALVALTACGEASRHATPDNCVVQTSSAWNEFTIRAIASGADCTQALVVLTIHSPRRGVVYTDSFAVAQVPALTGAASPAVLERRLRVWIPPPGAARDSTGDLPQWASNAEYPMSGEFPFHPETLMGAETYESLRERDTPMLCFVQREGREACFSEERGVITKIGEQTFPE